MTVIIGILLLIATLFGLLGMFFLYCVLKFAKPLELQVQHIMAGFLVLVISFGLFAAGFHIPAKSIKTYSNPLFISKTNGVTIILYNTNVVYTTLSSDFYTVPDKNIWIENKSSFSILGRVLEPDVTPVIRKEQRDFLIH